MIGLKVKSRTDLLVHVGTLFVALVMIVAAVGAWGGCNKRRPPQGVAAMTPSWAEAMLAFDEQTRRSYPLVAVSRYTSDPRVPTQIPTLPLGGNLEVLTALRPAVVLLHTSDRILAGKLARLGIFSILHAMDTIADIKMAVVELGAFMNARSQAQAINKNLDHALETNEHLFRRNGGRILHAIVIVDSLDGRMQQFYIAQSPAYLVDLLYGCGINTVSLSHEPWARLSAEKLLDLDPEMIIYFAKDRADAHRIEALFRQYYQDLRAVQNRALFVYDDSRMTVPGPEIGERQTQLCQKLQPFRDSAAKKLSPF